MKNASNVCLTFITKPTCSNESIKVEALYCSLYHLSRSRRSISNSQQMRDTNRTTRQLEARHKNQRTSSRRRALQQKCFILPKWQFLLLLWGVEPHTEHMEGSVVARRDRSNQWVNVIILQLLSLLSFMLVLEWQFREKMLKRRYVWQREPINGWM